MKNLTLLISSLLFLSVGYGQKLKPRMVKNFWDYNNSVMRSQGYQYADDFSGETTLEHGTWKYWDRQGRIEEERTYIKGVLNGRVTRYYSNGKKKDEGFFKEGKQDSIYTSWHENGNVKEKGNFKGDRAIGEWKYYYTNGYHMMEEKMVDSLSYVQNFWRMDSTHSLKNGDGRIFMYYSSTGHLQEFYTYKDGLKEGDFEEFTAAGNIFAQGQYAANKKVGDWTYWYYTGQVDRKLSYKGGALDGPYVKNYDNGKVNIETSYKEGLEDGEKTIWGEDGKILFKGRYSDGTIV